MIPTMSAWRPAIESIELDGNKAIKTEALLDGLSQQGLKEGEIFKQATLERVDRLLVAPVMPPGLRAAVSLVTAALAAEGETVVNRVYHLDRGFERLEDKLNACGGLVERISA